MQTIAILKQKGGAGATTLAVHLAVAAREAGRRPAILDADPQASALAWGEDRAEQQEIPHPPVLPAPRADELPHLIQHAASQGYDLVLVDTPPHSSGITAAVARAADLALIPTAPDTVDLRALPAMLQIVRATETPFVLALNLCPDRAPEVREARAWLEGAVRAVPSGVRARVWPGEIARRRAFPRAYGQALGITEFESRGKAADEIRALWTYLQKQLSR